MSYLLIGGAFELLSLLNSVKYFEIYFCKITCFFVIDFMLYIVRYIKAWIESCLKYLQVLEE